MRVPPYANGRRADYLSILSPLVGLVLFAITFAAYAQSTTVANSDALIFGARSPDPDGGIGRLTRESTIEVDLTKYLPAERDGALYKVLLQAAGLTRRIGSDGVPYRQHSWRKESDAANLKVGIDCSRAIWYAFTRAGVRYNDSRGDHALGDYLWTGAMASRRGLMSNQFERCSVEDLKLGDLLVYRGTNSRGRSAGHTVMVIDPEKKIAWGSHGWDNSGAKDTGVEFQRIGHRRDWNHWDLHSMPLVACWRHKAFSSDPPPPQSFQDPLTDGGLGPKMKRLEGGHFKMGSNRGNPDERPAHQVEISPFAIGLYEVTFDEYDRYCRSAGRRCPNDGGMGRGRHPVIDVSWNEAQGYLRWLSEQSGRGYRLPTEAEWEYAARAGSSSSYWWGSSSGRDHANCRWCLSRGGGRTLPVGSLKPNPFGLYDTAGNVYEWVEDAYLENGYSKHASKDPIIRDGGDQHVRRGGGWRFGSRYVTNTFRGNSAADARRSDLGFRVARDLEE